MIAFALASALALAAPQQLGLDLHGRAGVGGLGASLSLPGLGALRLDGAGGLDPRLRAFAATAALRRGFGPVELGARLSAGTSLLAGLDAAVTASGTSLSLGVGYSRGTALIDATGLSALVFGQGLVGRARLEAPLGPLSLYGTLRYGLALGRSSSALAKPPAQAGAATPPSATPPCTCGCSGFWQGTAPAALSASRAASVLVPGAGLALGLFRGSSLYAEAEWLPTGPAVLGGLRFTFDRAAPRPALAAPAAAPAPAPPPLPELRVLLSDGGVPLAGTIALDGPRRFVVTASAAGATRVAVQPGTYRATFRAPGHLAREAMLAVGADGLRLDEELTRAPARRSVMRTKDGVKLLRRIEFIPGTTALTPEALELLDEVADLAVDEPDRKVLVTAHVDSGADDPADLSRAQAAVVVAYLSTRVVPSRLDGRGAGASDPVIPNLTADARSLNRRVAIALR